MRKNGKNDNNRLRAVQGFKSFFALILVLCCIIGGIRMFPWDRKETAKSGGAVTVSISKTGISIGNDYLSREYIIKDGHINTSAIRNMRMEGGRSLEMEEGSEDFAIRLFDEDYPSGELNKTGWKVTITNGDGTEFPQSEAARLADGSTLIHPQIADSIYEKAPFTLDLDLGSEQTVSSFSIDKRSGDCGEADGIDGTMGKYKLYVSEDGINYTPAGEGN